MKSSHKIRTRTIFSTLVFISMICLAASSRLFSEKRFTWPLLLPERLSGTQGEKRGNYFHYGIDFITNGQNGHPVHAATAGRLHRLLSSESGYGNALVFDNGGGMQTLYGHCSAFEDRKYQLDSMAQFIRELYNTPRLDFRFSHTGIWFNARELIAYTGESGSGLPHLHFEVRDRTGTVNPLKFFSIKDRTAPVIERVYLCHERGGVTVYEQEIPLEQKGGKPVAIPEKIKCPPAETAFLKIACFDRVNADNRVAVYKIQLFDDGIKTYEMALDHVRWDDYPYGNLIYDPSHFIFGNTFAYTYTLCKRPGNNFSGISRESNGYFRLNTTKRLKVVVSDISGNQTKLSLNLVPDRSKPPVDDFVPAWRNRTTTLKTVGGALRIDIGPYSLPADSLVSLRALQVEQVIEQLHRDCALTRDDCHAIHELLPADIVYARPVSISIKRPAAVDPNSTGSYLICQWQRGGRPTPLKTWYQRRTDTFEAQGTAAGLFALIRDRIPPYITLPPTHELTEDQGGIRKLRFSISDNLSGPRLGSLECFIDGEKFPFAYERDRTWIELRLPKTVIQQGLHHVLVCCRDNCDNYREFRGVFGF